jgi:hypothetical protein
MIKRLGFISFAFATVLAGCNAIPDSGSSRQSTIGSWIVSNPGAFSVAGLNFPGDDDGWRISCRITMTSGAFSVGDATRQIVQLEDYGPILSPRDGPGDADREWQLLLNSFPDWNFSMSTSLLSGGALEIKDYEALAAGSGAPAGEVGASLLLKYNPTGDDPTEIDWIQFLYTDAPLGMDPPLRIDNEGAAGQSPFYNRGGGTASDAGFYDLPSRTIRQQPIHWHADLFVTEELAPVAGRRTVQIWGGISWGWYTQDAAL